VALAPVAPMCFSTRLQWVEYVVACAIDQRDQHLPGPLVIEPGQPVRFNPNFSFCEDCDGRHQGQMSHLGKCKPRHLIDLFAVPATAPKEPA
jgi:hypothetical protein